MGMSLAHARNWRIMAFGSFALSIVLVGGLLWQSAQANIYTYVVELDKTGQPGRIQLASDNYQPGRSVVAYTIADLIKKVRSRPTDVVVMKQNWNLAYDFLVGEARQRMNEFGSTIDFSPEANKAVSIEIVSIIEKSETSMQAEWREIEYERGVKTSTKTYTGLFTYMMAPPETEEQVFKNPLGIFIKSFSWGLERQ